ncbi:MAG: DUF1549 domain-containing protein [Planctomycetota bacterium]
MGIVHADDGPRREQPVNVTVEIDRLLVEFWNEQAIQPAPRSSDAEFCRRVWLDLAGVTPPVWKLRTFLADSSTEKRSRLVDELLESSRFAKHMANRWTDSLLPDDSSPALTEQATRLNEWLRGQFLSNRPYDHLVGSFLTAGGSQERGPAVFYTSRQADPVKLASATSRVFMGIQLECAQCHDHPFADWSQEDFWSFAAFYSQVELDDVGSMSTQVIRDQRGKQVVLPETEQVMEPRYPGVEGIPEPDPTDFRRRQLTIWLASRDNPFFARSAANRVWAHLFGRGLVDPIDEMDIDNPPSHPEILERLTEVLIDNRFDLRELYRVIAKSQAYSLSSEMRDVDFRQSNATRPTSSSFAVMGTKTLSPEQFYDSIRQNVYLAGQRTESSAEMPSAAGRDLSRQLFLSRMRGASASPSEYPHGVVQTLGMMNGPEMSQAISPATSGLIQSLDAPFLSDRQRIETLFLACLSRLPAEPELERFLQFLSSGDPSSSRQDRLSDIVWVLLNTSESFLCP